MEKKLKKYEENAVSALVLRIDTNADTVAAAAIRRLRYR